MITFGVDKIEDPVLREHFLKLEELFRTFPFYLAGFKLFELNLPSAVTNKRIPHHMGMIPKDVIQTFLSGTGAITWNQTLFDKTYLDITTTGPVKVRAFIGTCPT